MTAYGCSDCGNYLCHLLWTFSIWVCGPDGDALKWFDLGDPDGGAVARSITLDAEPPSRGHPTGRESGV